MSHTAGHHNSFQREGMVHHVRLGTYIFGDRFDRRGIRLWWPRRYGKLHRPSALLCVPRSVSDQPNRPAVSTAGGLG